MGNDFSKCLKHEANIDSTGQVNNDIIVEDHVQITNTTALMVLYGLYKDHMSQKRTTIDNDVQP